MIRRITFYKHIADKYEYFTFYIREIVSSFQDQLDPSVTVAQTDAYFLHMGKEMVRFLSIHAKMVQNIKHNSMLPLLMMILLDQITEDMYLVLRESPCPRTQSN